MKSSDTTNTFLPKLLTYTVNLIKIITAWSAFVKRMHDISSDTTNTFLPKLLSYTVNLLKIITAWSAFAKRMHDIR